MRARIFQPTPLFELLLFSSYATLCGCNVCFSLQISFGFPVSDALVAAFGHVSEGDVLYQRGLHAEALTCYRRCIDTAGAFKGAQR